ncbi:MAG: PAS domain S-box protein, partial [Deltaproteobacteria bacterium]
MEIKGDFMVNMHKKLNPAEVYKKADFGEPFYKFIIENIPVAIVTVNADFRITGFNPWAETVTGYSEKEALGRSCSKVLKGTNCRFNCPLKGALKHEKSFS